MIARRHVVMGTSAALLACALPPIRFARGGDERSEGLARAFADIETKVGGRLGVAVHDTGSGLKATRRGNERFPLCSTFKLLAAGAILARVDEGEESLDRDIAIRQEDIVTYSPGTEPHVGQTMTLAEICEAAITLSDNTAGNLMLEAIGGPQAFNAYLRSLGDEATRLDRIEPDLNEAAPGDQRDTTTPPAMAADLHRLLAGDALSARSRDQLAAWLIANKTGDARLRAGLPPGWRVGDKTGTCNSATANDVGIAWPPGRPPVLVAVYLAETTAAPDAQNAAIADVARAVAAAIG